MKKKICYVISVVMLGGIAAQAALIAEWNFDNQSTADTLGLHNGIYATGVDYTGDAYSTNTPSGSGYALDLTAANTHMLVQDSANGDGYFEPGAFSYVMWIKSASLTNAPWNSFASKQNEGAGVGWVIRLAGAGPGTQTDFFGSGAVSGGGINLSDDQWHHVAMTYDGTNLVYYIDGSPVGSGALTYNPATTSWLNFGSWDTGGGRPLGGLMDEIQVYDHALSGGEVLVLSGSDPEPFPVVPALVGPNLIPNGSFSLITDKTPDPADPATWNIIGSFGDFVAFENHTANVPGWSPYQLDSNGLSTNVGIPHVVTGDSGLLNGTFYLDTTWNVGAIVFNSTMDYLNGLVQEDILSAVEINTNTSYQLSVDFIQSAGTDVSGSTFTAALTAGADATNTALAVNNGLIQVDGASYPASAGTLQTTLVSGADLAAAGQVNVLFNHVNATPIPGWPGTGLELIFESVAQVRVNEISLAELLVAELGDVNHDTVVDDADVTLAFQYLTGAIDGGIDAATRQTAMIAGGMTTNEALVYLNLTEFDIDGDDFFDADDITALEALAVVEPLVLQIAGNGSALDFTWNSKAAQAYDLWASDSLVITNWALYNDGVTTYEGILASGTGTNTLTGVLASGAVNFFRLTEGRAPPMWPSALIAEWNFDDQTTDDTLGLHDGITPNGAAYSMDTPTSSGYSVNFTTANSHMLVTDSANGDGYFEPAAFSYSMWIKSAGWTDGVWQGIATKQNEGAGTGWAMRRSGVAAHTRVDFFGAGAVEDSQTTDLMDNQWHHLAVTYNGTTLTYYIDGAVVGASDLTYIPATTEWLNFGSWGADGSRGYVGLMDEIRCFNRALTGAEVLDLANP